MWLALMVALDRVEILQREFANLHNFCVLTEARRQRQTRFGLILSFQDDPGFVLTVKTSPLKI